MIIIVIAAALFIIIVVGVVLLYGLFGFVIIGGSVHGGIQRRRAERLAHEKDVRVAKRAWSSYEQKIQDRYGMSSVEFAKRGGSSKVKPLVADRHVEADMRRAQHEARKAGLDDSVEAITARRYATWGERRPLPGEYKKS